MEGEVLQQFVNMTGADTDFALSFLEANGWNLESAINLYLEGNFGANSDNPPPKAAGGAGERGTSVKPPPRARSPDQLDQLGGITNEQGGGENFDPRTVGDEEMARAMSDIPPEMYDNGGEMFDEDGVRAPIMPVSETLVEEDPYTRIAQARLRAPRGEANVFDMFRDYRHETLTAKGGDDPSTKKIKTLADLFRPPVDLIEGGTFDHAKQTANRRKKWLLVNIQETSEFDCQKLNRDTWSDSAVKSVVRANFILWQMLKTSEEGARYCRFYPVDIVPHIAIIDSRTGEQLDAREGFIEPKDLVVMLENFIATNSLDDNTPTRPPAESPTKRIGDLTEEAQLAAAVAASLGQSPPPVSHVPATTPPPTTAPHPPTTTTTTTPPPVATAPTAAPTTTTTTPAQPTTTATPTITPTVQPPKEEPPQPSANLLAEHSSQTAECTCTIQIRMPSETIKGFFRPTDTLRTVHQYVSLHMNPKKEFVLVTTFPKKTYSGDQLDTTLKQADLVPRAVLICELTE